ncbi:MAG: 4Fe-4S dicluster domain-containing protein [Thermodesulfobacteriota bacterium]
MTTTRPPIDETAELEQLHTMVQACMQCGTCSASCPNSAFMDLTPRQIWRLVLYEQFEAIWATRTFWLCSNCYTCTLRCPRGLPLTEAVNTLKRLAPRDTLQHRRQAAFYDVFMDSVRRYGRVPEMDMMLHYFWAMRDPRVPLAFTPLGTKLLRRGKVHPGHPRTHGRGKLDHLFAKAQLLEGAPCATPTTPDAP